MNSPMTSSTLSSFIRKNIVYIVSVGFERSIAFLLLPLYTHVLLPAEYGVVAVWLSFIMVASFLYSLGIENGLLKYSVDDDAASLNATTFWGMTTLAVVFSTLIFLFSDSLAVVLFRCLRYAFLVKLSAVILLTDTIGRYFHYGFLGRQESRKVLLVAVLRGMLTIAANVYFLVIRGMDFEGVVLSYLSASVVVALFLLLTAERSHRLNAFHIPILKRILSFGVPVMLTSLFLTLLHFLDRYLLQVFASSAETGQYSVAYRIGFVMHLVVTAFSMGAVPFVSDVLKKSEKGTGVLQEMLRYLFLACLSLFCLVSLFVKDVAHVSWFGFSIIHHNYWEGLDLVPLVLLAYLFYGLYVHFSLSAYHREKTRVLSLVSLTALLCNVVLNHLLIPLYGASGAAVATLISFFVLAALMAVLSHRILPVRYPSRGGLVLLLLGMVLVAYSRYVLFEMFWLKTLLYVLFQVWVVLMVLKPRFSNPSHEG